LGSWFPTGTRISYAHIRQNISGVTSVPWPRPTSVVANTSLHPCYIRGPC